MPSRLGSALPAARPLIEPAWIQQHTGLLSLTHALEEVSEQAAERRHQEERRRDQEQRDHRAQADQRRLQDEAEQRARHDRFIADLEASRRERQARYEAEQRARDQAAAAQQVKGEDPAGRRNTDGEDLEDDARCGDPQCRQCAQDERDELDDVETDEPDEDELGAAALAQTSAGEVITIAAVLVGLGLLALLPRASSSPGASPAAASNSPPTT